MTKMFKKTQNLVFAQFSFFLFMLQGCTSVHLGFVSHDEDAEVSYVSTQRPHHRDVFAMVRQACVRSLSCEVTLFKQSIDK